MPITNLIGPRLMQVRLLHKPVLSREQLAARLKDTNVVLTPDAIKRIELKKRRVKDYELLALARALGVSTQWLLTGRHDL